MTAYQGGKKKIGKQLSIVLKQVEKDHGKEDMDYFEPFCGMCGVLNHMNNGKRKIIANDLNTDIIMMWKAVQDGWVPEYKEYDEEEYKQLVKDKPSKERSFYTIAHSFHNEFLGPRRSNIVMRGQNYITCAINGVKKINVDNVVFENKSYTDYNPKGMLIYCDPPYMNNKFSRNIYFKDFDYKLFWNKMREWSKNNLVIVSEYEAPEDFTCIWDKEYKWNVNAVNQKTKENGSYNYKKIEKLFVYR